jgi:hypothetical protein
MRIIISLVLSLILSYLAYQLPWLVIGGTNPLITLCILIVTAILLLLNFLLIRSVELRRMSLLLLTLMVSGFVISGVLGYKGVDRGLGDIPPRRYIDYSN